MTTMAGWQRALIALLSAGWVVPMLAGCWTMLHFVQVVVWPLLQQQPASNSFNFPDDTMNCFLVGFLWLGIVIAGWAWVATGLIARRAPSRPMY